MGRNSKYSKEIKIQACQDYINGKASYRSIAKNIGAHPETVRQWCFVYQEHGESGFSHSHKNSYYTKEFKDLIVDNYMSGQTSSFELGANHNISPSVLRNWVKKYYNGIEQIDYMPKPEVYTMKSRKTTYQERFEIVQWILGHNMNYKEAASKYGIRYSLLYSWVRKYNENGANALQSQKRGPKRKSAIDESSMSETERLRYELEREKTLRKHAELKVEVLKKKEEIEKSLHSRK